MQLKFVTPLVFFVLGVDAARYNRANWIGLAGMTAVGAAFVGIGIALLLAKAKTESNSGAKPAPAWVTRLVGSVCLCGGIVFVIYTWLFHPVTWL